MGKKGGGGAVRSHSLKEIQRTYHAIEWEGSIWMKLNSIEIYFIYFIAWKFDDDSQMLQFLEDVSALIQEASSVLTNWRGVAGF